MLEQITNVLRHRELVRSFGEVDRSIIRHVEIVQTTKLDAVCSVGQQFHFARFVNRQQSLDRISDEQIPVAIEDQSERTAMRLGKNARLPAVSLRLLVATIGAPAVNSPVRIKCYIFGPVALAHAQSLNGRKTRVLSVRTGQRGSNWRRPGTRIDRHRRKEQVNERCSNECDDEGKNVSFQSFRSEFNVPRETARPDSRVRLLDYEFQPGPSVRSDAALRRVRVVGVPASLAGPRRDRKSTRLNSSH